MTIRHAKPEDIDEMLRIYCLAKEYMDKGLLVPDELVVDLVVDRLAQDDAKNVMTLPIR